MKKQIWFNILVVFTLVWPFSIAQAQEPPPEVPVYVVQTGDSLWIIAQRFGVSVDAVTKANGMTDPNQLVVGMELKIPGLQGVSGQLLTQPVLFGESLRSLSRRYGMPVETLARLNRLVNPGELYVGKNLILTNKYASGSEPGRSALKNGGTLLELAASQGVNPWVLVNENFLSGSWQSLPGDVLQTPSQEDATQAPSALPGDIKSVEIKSLPLVQGKAAVLRLTASGLNNLQGSLAGYKLNFFQSGEEYIALQGIHSMLAPGFYDLSMSWELSDGTASSFSQMVYIKDGGYLYETLPVTDESLIDPAVTQPEEDELKALMANNTATKLWEGIFSSPVDAEFTECWPSTFGRRRSYNGSAFTYTHSGLDFCGQVGQNIYAPAPGKVVLVDAFPVRGNVTVLDHGWGVFSLYAHQYETQVKVGDVVTAGQIIGLVGATGRVTGAHLHWELWAGDIQVDPWDWLKNVYP